MKCIFSFSLLPIRLQTDACKTHYTIPVYTADFLKISPQV